MSLIFFATCMNISWQIPGYFLDISQTFPGRFLDSSQSFLGHVPEMPQTSSRHFPAFYRTIPRFFLEVSREMPGKSFFSVQNDFTQISIMVTLTGVNFRIDVDSCSSVFSVLLTRIWKTLRPRQQTSRNPTNRSRGHNIQKSTTATC